MRAAIFGHSFVFYQVAKSTLFITQKLLGFRGLHVESYSQVFSMSSTTSVVVDSLFIDAAIVFWRLCNGWTGKWCEDGSMQYLKSSQVNSASLRGDNQRLLETSKRFKL